MAVCKHSACTCDHQPSEMVTRDGDHYCSQHCAEADPKSKTCGCEHEDCEGG